jgi:hypothetical protein
LFPSPQNLALVNEELPQQLLALEHPAIVLTPWQVHVHALKLLVVLAHEVARGAPCSPSPECHEVARGAPRSAGSHGAAMMGSVPSPQKVSPRTGHEEELPPWWPRLALHLIPSLASKRSHAARSSCKFPGPALGAEGGCPLGNFQSLRHHWHHW